MSKTMYPRGNYGPEVEGEYKTKEDLGKLDLIGKADGVKKRVEEILPIDVKELNRFLKGKD